MKVRMSMRSLAGAFGAMAIAFAVKPLAAQTESQSYIQGYTLRADDAFATHGPEILGHKVNLYTGGLEFEHTDVELPGNNALPVAFIRKHVAGQHRPNGMLGNWSIEAPRISGSFSNSQGWVNGSGTTARCSNFTAPPFIGFVNTFQYWQGTFLTVPGQGGGELLTRAPANVSAPADGFTYPLVTKDHWQIRCLSSIKNGSGEGFVARSPNGEEYRFDWMTSRFQNGVKNESTTVARSEFALMATEVKDRFGNWVRYAYDAASPRRLTAITSSDGRAITIGYGSNGLVSSVSDGTRTWSYMYGGGTPNTGTELSAVIQPDGSRWEFSLTPMVHALLLELGESASCNFPGRYPEATYTGTVKHPSGLSASFNLEFRSTSRSNVTRVCTGPYPGGSGAVWQRTLTRQMLTSMSVSGPGVPTATWTYGLGGGVASWYPCNPCVDTKTVYVRDPRGVETRHTYGVRFLVNEGQLLSTDEAFDGTTALRRTTYRYREPAGMAYPEPPGISIRYDQDFLSYRHRPQDQRITTQQGVTFKWEAAAGAAGFDARARPIRATRSSSLGYSKTETTAYHDNTAKWVLGQVASVTDSSGAVQDSSTYDATTALRTAKLSFGLKLEGYAYHPDGTLRIRYDAGNRATTFANYKRGIAQNVTFPDSTAESAVVNNLGRVSSFTNAAGTTTSYTYDAMGRLAGTTHPNEASLTYHATTRAYEQVAFAELGLGAGHWRQTTTTGNARKVRYFDALSRERLAVEWDAANPGNTSRYVETRYDIDGRKTFLSYPVRTLSSIGTAVAGTAWLHDGLGRVYRQVQDSELGPLTTNTAHLANFRRRTTNARGFATEFAFQAFDSPSEDAIAAVWAPEGSTLSIVRDRYGKPTSITRSGSYGGASVSATRSYVYDANQRLCKSIEPETGATVQAYDAANNLAWRANGLNLTSTTSCDQTSVPAGRQITYAYDTRNRLTATHYGDGSPGIGRNYTADGMLSQIWSGNSTWTYGYNNRRLMVSENSFWSGSGNYTFQHGIDAYGNAASLVYPTGFTVAYSPNALGQPTQVSGYASSVWHHPNGMIGGYTLANGIAHLTTQNTRGLPAVWRDAAVTQDAYAYDANANVTAITDQLAGAVSTSRSMGYDGLDRLTMANGSWGTGSFGYDSLDNLRTSTVGARTAVASIDGANRLGGLTVNGVMQGYGYDAGGNLTVRGAQTFTFDIGNRLNTAWGKASYAYDGHGRRLQMLFNNGTSRLQFYGQGGKLLLSRFFGAGDYTYHVYLGDRLIAETNTVTGTSYSHTDALGSPVARTNSSAQVTSRTRYEPYGATAGGTIPNGIGFTGHVDDPDTSLVYMQQRYYEPIAARFLSVDPITTEFKTGGHFNRYAYAQDNPYKYVDPDGEAPATAGRPDGPGGSVLGGGAGPHAGPPAGGARAAPVNTQGASSRAAQIKSNVEQGKAGEAATRQQLGDRVAGEQVTFKTSDGTRTRPDFVTKDKAVVETKTGSSPLSNGQQKLKDDIDAGRNVTPVGRNAENAGLTSGQPTKMSCCTVDRQATAQ
jgi:RHS repeat-associated protein